MIKIQYDCPESNSEMVKTDNGFYCKSCSKEVFDFTEKTKEEIAEINAKNPSISCGVFTIEQAVVDTRSRVQNIFRMAFAAIFVFGLNVSMIFGQDVNSESTAVLTKTEVSVDGVFISGELKDEKGNAIEGWIIYFYGDESISIDTDAEGKFKIELPQEAIGQTINVSFYARGYHLKELEIELKAAKCYTYQIELKKYNERLLQNRRTRGMYIQP